MEGHADEHRKKRMRRIDTQRNKTEQTKNAKGEKRGRKNIQTTIYENKTNPRTHKGREHNKKGRAVKGEESKRGTEVTSSRATNFNPGYGQFCAIGSSSSGFYSCEIAATGHCSCP